MPIEPRSRSPRASAPSRKQSSEPQPELRSASNLNRYLHKELSAPVPRGCMAGWTALHMAANGADEGGIRPTILEELLKLGADPTVLVQGKNGKTTSVLYRAASTGHVEAVYALLATGKFDAHEENSVGCTIADAAHHCNHELESWLTRCWGVPCHTPHTCISSYEDVLRELKFKHLVFSSLQTHCRRPFGCSCITWLVVIGWFVFLVHQETYANKLNRKQWQAKWQAQEEAE